MSPARDKGTEDLDPHARRFLKLLSSVGSGPDAPDVQARRRSLEDLATLAGGAPPAAAEIDEIWLTRPGGDLRLRRYSGTPGAPGRAPCIIYLHGGGWCAGSLDTHDAVCRTLAEAGGLTVLAVDYRLAPEHPFPAGLDDAVFALCEVAARADELGVDPGRLAIAGDSAGATLAAAATVIVRDLGDPNIALQLLICPILDVLEARPSRIAFAEGFFLNGETFARDLADYLPPGLSRADPRVSPLRAPSLAGLPPAHIHVAAFDPFRDEGLAYAERLATADVATRTHVHPGMIHYFYALPGLIPPAGPALQAIARAARAALG